MSFGGFIRRNLYWGNDFLHKSPVGKHYRDIQTILANKNGVGLSLQKQHLINLLQHAVENTKFYSECDSNNIETFPIINKIRIRENHDAIQVQLSKVPEHKGNLHIQRTSGSTGTPMAIPQDKRKRNRRIAELKYFGKIAGYNSHEKLAQLRIWTKWHSKNKAQSFKENIYPIDCSIIDDAMLTELCNLIRKEKIVALWGYASWYDKLADYIERTSTRLPSVKVLMAGSEMLQPQTRIKLKALLHCDIVSRYSNEEQGILGQDCDNDVQFYLNHASYYFEFLKLHSNEKAEPGEICRLVITDLFNYAFPLIRYDTGDTGVYSPETENSNGFPVLAKIYGRILDLVYATNGEAIHPMALARIIKNYDGVELWQFIQKHSNNYELRLKLSSDIDIQDCLLQLKMIFGTNARIDIKMVNDIPVLSSGKRRPVVNEWKQ